jgi:hypothetical protein
MRYPAVGFAHLGIAIEGIFGPAQASELASNAPRKAWTRFVSSPGSLNWN